MSVESSPNGAPRLPRSWIAAALLVVVLGTGGGAAAGFAAGRSAAPNTAAPSAAAPAPAISIEVASEPVAVSATAASLADLVERVLPAVVTIETRDAPFSESGRQGSSIGTGFFYTSDGMILTNAHVLPSDDGQLRVATGDGRRFEAAVVGRDIWGDVAVLKVTGGPFPTLELGDSDALRVGEQVVAVGSPLNFRDTVTLGIISGKDRRFPKPVRTDSGVLNLGLRGMLQTDAAVNQGNSGGPLIDLAGRVVGINTAVRGDATNLGFALAMSRVRANLDELVERGAVARGYLGVRYQVIDPTLDRFDGSPFPYAAVISGIIGDATARQAGLQNGDVIISINGTTLARDYSLSDAVDGLGVGDEISFTLRRSGAEMTLSAPLQDRPEPLADQG